MTNYLGTAGDDTLTGTAVADFFQGFAGADQLYGGDGNDIVHGGLRADFLYGGNNDDILLDDDAANADADQIYGGGGVDYMYLGAGGSDKVVMDTTVSEVAVIYQFDPTDPALGRGLARHVGPAGAHHRLRRLGRLYHHHTERP